MKRKTTIRVLAVALATLALASCQQQPTSPPAGGETRPEAPATNAPAPSMGTETQPPVPESSQPAPSMGTESQPPSQETNQPPSGGPTQ